MRRFDIHALMEGLAKKRPVFHSEADFQFALAWEIRAKTRREIRLEFPPFPNESMRLDIWVPDIGTAIELKYLTRKLNAKEGNESFALRDQSAQDIRRYDFVKDIERLERVVAEAPSERRGIAVLVTNDPLYWTPPTGNTIDTAFRLHQPRRIGGDMRWSERASRGTTKGRESPIVLTASYVCEWRNYGHPAAAGESYAQFRYLAVQVVGREETDPPRRLQK